jgi:hypothetical protein
MELEIGEIMNVLENSEEMQGYEIIGIKKRKNYSITFIKHDNLEEDLTGLYEGLARILYA